MITPETTTFGDCLNLFGPENHGDFCLPTGKFGDTITYVVCTGLNKPSQGKLKAGFAQIELGLPQTDESFYPEDVKELLAKMRATTKMLSTKLDPTTMVIV